MFYKDILRPILFAISEDDPERAHQIILRSMKTLQRIPPILNFVTWMSKANRNVRPVVYKNLVFKHDIGLAAGFDKQCEVMPFIEAMGFAFATGGTALPLPQPGSERPRMFRLPEYRAIINRMGFNSEGAENVRRNLQSTAVSVGIPIGISVSKNKETPLDADAVAQDCIRSLVTAGEVPSYLEIGISSPNTPGLRDMQSVASSRIIIKGVVAAERTLAGWFNRDPRTIIVKLTCDMNEDDAVATTEASLEEGADGIAGSNTTVERVFSGAKPQHADETGGLSGPPLHERAVRFIERLRRVDDKMLLIGIGGVEDGVTADHFRTAGANLIAMYTGVVYGGIKAIRSARHV